MPLITTLDLLDIKRAWEVQRCGQDRKQGSGGAKADRPFSLGSANPWVPPGLVSDLVQLAGPGYVSMEVGGTLKEEGKEAKSKVN